MTKQFTHLIPIVDIAPVHTQSFDGAIFSAFYLSLFSPLLLLFLVRIQTWPEYQNFDKKMENKQV